MNLPCDLSEYFFNNFGHDNSFFTQKSHTKVDRQLLRLPIPDCFDLLKFSSICFEIKQSFLWTSKLLWRNMSRFKEFQHQFSEMFSVRCWSPGSPRAQHQEYLFWRWMSIPGDVFSEMLKAQITTPHTFFWRWIMECLLY